MSLTEPESLALGTIVADRYRLDRLLGRGGFGAVYAATRVGGGRVALKILSNAVLAETGGEARFRREAELASRLSHPNTVRVLDVGADPRGLLFIAFELLEGRSLEDLLYAEGPIAPRRAAEITMKVLDALAEAHALGVVHRDIKPANLFLVRGGPMEIKVLDFGIAKSTNPTTRAGLTREGTTMGTPVYMSPEQTLGKEIGPPADLFALGVVLGEMVQGGSLYGASPSGIEIMTDRISGKLVPFSREVLATPLGPILARATAADIAHRYASATEMRNALGMVLAALPEAPLFTATPPDRPRSHGTFAGAATEVSESASASGDGLLRSPRAASVAFSPAPAMAPRGVTPTLAASQPSARGAADARPLGWDAAGYGPPITAPPLVAAPRSSSAGVVLAVVALALLAIIGAGGLAAAFVFRSAPAARDGDESASEEDVLPAPKKKPASSVRVSPDPTPPPRPQPQVPTPPGTIHERPCPQVDALSPTAIGPHATAIGLSVTGVLTVCEGNLVNFDCDGPAGTGVTAKGPDGDGRAFLLEGPRADLDRFLDAERREHGSEETLLEGRTKILVVDFAEPFGSRMAARVCR